MTITLNLNGRSHEVDADPGTPLLWVIRDELKLTGTKFGCGVAACGACTVHMDGEPVRSCQTYIEDVEGAEITTIEGLESKVSAAVQAAWSNWTWCSAAIASPARSCRRSGCSAKTPNPRPRRSTIT